MVQEIYIDFETGGLNPQIHGVSSVAIGNNNPAEDRVYYFTPEENKFYTSEAININKLELEELDAKGKPLLKIMHDIREKFFTSGERIRLIAHNAEFDGFFLLGLAKTCNVFLPGMELYCTMNEAKRRNFARINLGGVYETITGKTLEAHNALNDMRAVRTIYQYFNKK